MNSCSWWYPLPASGPSWGPNVVVALGFNGASLGSSRKVSLFLLPGGLNSCKQMIIEKEITPGSECMDEVVWNPRFTTALKYPFLHLTDGHLVPSWTLLWQILIMARPDLLYCYKAVFSGLTFLTFVQDYYPTFMPIDYGYDLYNVILLLFKNQDSSSSG